MKLKAIDTLHVSSVRPENLLAGEEFEVSEAVGQSLVDRGLAAEVKAKAAPAPQNKAEPAPKNKASN